MNSILTKHGRKILFIIIIIIIVIIFFVFDFNKFLNTQAIRQWVDGMGVFAPLGFILIYYLAILLFLPASGFSVLAGALFGTFYGVIYTVIAATLAAQTAFYLARFFGHDLLEKLPKKGVGKRIREVDAKIGKNSFKTFFVLRCLFLPFIALSYAAGLSKKANAFEFFLATFLTNLIFTPAFVYFGESLLEGPKALILPVALISLVLLVPRVVRRWKK